MASSFELQAHDDHVRILSLGFLKIYYPILAVVSVPVNVVTIVILSRGKCGLSRCVTRYLVGMAAADLQVVIFDLILRQIPIVYWEQFTFLYSVPVCNIHAVLLYAATDCSVWFTVTFTFDRFVAICCQKLKVKYCTERTAAVVLGTVGVLSGLKDIFWYFMLGEHYLLMNIPWFCAIHANAVFSRAWAVVETIHYILTPGFAFAFILLLNILTVRYILMANRTRRRLRGQRTADSRRDPEMESRRKSIILLFVISGNFILLWAMFMVNSIWRRLVNLNSQFVYLALMISELGFMFQLLSCCTNTCIYAVTQSKFREQLNDIMKYPFILIAKRIKR